MKIKTVINDSDDDEDEQSNDDKDCDVQTSCNDCIRLPQCVYCIDANFTKDRSRCMSR